jgi:hypothetical protein
MSSSIWLRIILTWLLFLPIPIINGLLREKWYKKAVGETAAHQIGTVVVSGFFLLYAYISLASVMNSFTNFQLWLIGFVWLVLTLVFEFGLGLANGRSWEYMLADYKIWRGRIWVIVLMVVLVSPFFVKWLMLKNS